MTPGKNYGKDNYTTDLTGAEATYWLGTESGLLGAFQFDGACTAGDGSCDVRSLSMGAGFCNLNSLKWLTEEPLTPTRMHEQEIETITQGGTGGGRYELQPSRAGGSPGMLGGTSG